VEDAGAPATLGDRGLARVDFFVEDGDRVLVNELNARASDDRFRRATSQARGGCVI
jgi:hypothetical protein